MEARLDYKQNRYWKGMKKCSYRKQVEKILYEFYQKYKIIQTRVYAGLFVDN